MRDEEDRITFGTDFYLLGTDIVRTGRDRLEARTSSGLRAISAFVFLVGLWLIIGAASELCFPRSSGPTGQRSFWGCFSVFFGVSGLFYVLLGRFLWGPRKMIFDGRSRVLRCKKAGRGLPREIPFDDIEAVEKLSKYKRTGEERIELVLSRPVGGRIPVTMRGNEDKALHDASVLAEFIGIPMRHVRRTVVPAKQARTGK